jgi:hypothetical protein
LIDAHSPSAGFEFGTNQLWIDRFPGLSQAEPWLELIMKDVSAASDHLKSAGVVRCDEIEPLPEGFHVFWISSPASIIPLSVETTSHGRGASNEALQPTGFAND